MKKLIIVFIIIFFIPVLCIGDEFKIPHRLEAGQDAVAEVFNENFEALEREINNLQETLNSFSEIISSASRTGVEILASNSMQSAVNAEFKDTFTIESAGILFFQSSSTATYTGKVRNAGIDIQLTVNENLCAQNMSFEGESASIAFHAGATCIRLLKPGTHTLNSKRKDHGPLNGNIFNAGYWVVKTAK